MAKRTLTITIAGDMRARLKAHVRAAVASGEYQGEHLDFATPDLFFSKLTANRWALAHALQGAGETGVRELARRVNRDVKRVHEDAAALVELGLIEKTENGRLLCPYADIHVDLHLKEAA
jgi:predicted transcriptional regulator